MNKLIRITLLLTLMAFSAGLYAQSAVAEKPSSGFMRSNGKIYVVVAVVVTILCGLFLYVFSLDRKISKLEKKS